MARSRRAACACQSATSNPAAIAKAMAAAALTANLLRRVNFEARYHNEAGRASTGRPSK